MTRGGRRGQRFFPPRVYPRDRSWFVIKMLGCFLAGAASSFVVIVWAANAAPRKDH